MVITRGHGCGFPSDSQRQDARHVIGLCHKLCNKATGSRRGAPLQSLAFLALIVSPQHPQVLPKTFL